jgi:hypothetical protein
MSHNSRKSQLSARVVASALLETARTLRTFSTSLGVITLGLCVAGCGDDGSSQESEGVDFSETLYALMVQVYDDQDRNVYISFSNTLDIDSVDLSKAREFPSVANFAAIDGHLLVSSGLAPEITEFDITAKGKWIDGRTVNFSDYPLGDNANFYAQFIVDSEHVLLPYEGTKRIVWNPSKMKIEKALDDTKLTPREPGLTLEAGGNRNGVRYDAAVMQALFYHDDEYYDYGSWSHIVVYDATTFAEKRVLDVPCPALSIATRDEQGSTYFSNWGLPTTSLTGAESAPCVAKVGPDQATVERIDLRDWTEGRYASNFRYVGGGKAFANVLHHEALGVSSPSELSAKQLEELWNSGEHWKLWLFDVEQQTGKAVEGIDVDIADGAQFAVLDGRTFVFLPYDDWARTKTYELMSDGSALERFDTTGDIYQWVQVR